MVGIGSVPDMPLRARTLLGPGPSNPYPEATVALGQPLLGHLDPAFLQILDETSDRLRQLFGTTNRRTLPLSATGSAGMEASFVNTVGPGDVVWIPPMVKHWHGASADEAMSHFAVAEAENGSVVTWMEKVSDDDYGETDGGAGE